MSRPTVSVVMPFAGTSLAAQLAIETLQALETQPGDELILADNSGGVVDRGVSGGVVDRAAGIIVVRAAAERSPAHARNIGAAHASAEWILFLDADCRAPSDLLARYFAAPVGEDVGALAGEVVPAPGEPTIAARYGAARSFLDQQAHLEHPFRPRAAAANLMVRRGAFEQVGGFYEGVRAAEDTDFTWRLQEAGWRLELRAGARVEHRYRTSVRELRRQWRGYAAGRAWLARRYDGFTPQPAVARALARAVRLAPPRRSQAPRRAGGGEVGRLERGSYIALDTLLAAEELAGLALSNRPGARHRAPADVVIIAEHFPAREDPLAELARTLDRARVEAVARPEVLDGPAARDLDIEYREDDGVAARFLALVSLLVRHPVRAALDLLRHRAGDPTLLALAPAARRLERDAGARVIALGAGQIRATAERLARLAGRRLEEPPRGPRLGRAIAHLDRGR